MIEIWLQGRGVGKARPRFGRNGRVHTCNRYRDWKDDAVTQLLVLDLPETPKPCKVNCYFVNFLSSDADNLVGSVLDAMVEAGVLENDSSSFVAGCSGQFAKTKKVRGEELPVGILVQILPVQIEYLDLQNLRRAAEPIA